MKKNNKSFLGIVCALFLLFPGLIAQDKPSYQTPPKEIADLINAPLSPSIRVNPQGDWMLFLEPSGYPSIEELAQPELRIAGIRINPRTNGTSRATYYLGMQLKNAKTGELMEVEGLPQNPKIQESAWSPDGKQIAFTLVKENGIELWHLEVESRKARALTKAVINDAMRGSSFAWMSDNKTILYKVVNPERAEVPRQKLSPKGPIVQENRGQKAPVRTYQDLLKNPYDEALFTYYTEAQLMSFDLEKNASQLIAPAQVISGFSASPDGNYMMLNVIQKPYSYLVPYYRFPFKVQILNPKGQLVKEIARIPLAENIPKGFGSVRKGPRSFAWRADQASTLYWVEAQDEGDPAKKVEFRDQLFMWKAPFKGEKQASIKFKLRYGGVIWGNENLALAREIWWSSREVVNSIFDPLKGQESKEVLFEYSSEDRYNNPGNFVTKNNEMGRAVLFLKDKKYLYLTGAGASPEGNRPFLDQLELTNKKKTRLWQNQDNYYEYPLQIMDDKVQVLLTRRESKDSPPNYLFRNLKNGKITELTNFRNPYESLKGVKKEVVHYKRKDGVDLKGDLYLPKDYQPGSKKLPVLIWAYPREFKNKKAAGQVSGSPYEFTRLSWASPIFWVTRGYAVLNRASMPILGEGEKEPNDSFREQLVANAKAAIDKLSEMGIADRDRIAIGGHSYGAFMTANLLAHSDLFAAGIARSGAYNRTLTPFGFQREQRTYWEAPEIYYQMSPFMHADKINEPILMIHGEADNNSGTFPIQSKRYYNALKGMGKTARLVMLPYESHGYRAKESINHMLWEMDSWLEKYVKNRSKSSENHQKSSQKAEGDSKE